MRPGRFVWFDLITDETQKGLAFYKDVFGWTTEEMDMGPGGTYTMLANRGMPMGGLMSLPGVPSHWLSYVEVDSVDDTVARAKRLGGKAIKEPTPIPGQRRFAIVGDAEGAALGLFSGPQDSPPLPQPLPDGSFCWAELHTRDAARAKVYYAELLGWRPKGVKLDDGQSYTVFKRIDDKDAAGMITIPSFEPYPPFWMPYVQVADVDATTTAAEAKGAKTYVAPRDITGYGRFSVFADPTGAVLAVYRKQA